MSAHIKRLRAQAIAHSLFPATTLNRAIERLGFIQADPIRSPAKAHDLILRHRVKGYRAGDLERRYESLGIEEDILYAYGFLARKVWQLLHPRETGRLSALEQKVLETVRKTGATHPRAMEQHFGKERVVNAWGGYSKATTHALDMLLYRGLLRIVRRENGIRVYEPAPDHTHTIAPEERLRRLVLAIANILAPIQLTTLRANVMRLKRLGNPRKAILDLIESGELREVEIDGIRYISPPKTVGGEVPRVVRFLAPFDPVVWDRRRFEHFWGWQYRFEAYTPPAKRVRGYYAMPLLWGDDVIGWINASVREGRLEVETGFVNNRPRDSAFRSELDAEVERLKIALGLK